MRSQGWSASVAGTNSWSRLQSTIHWASTTNRSLIWSDISCFVIVNPTGSLLSSWCHQQRRRNNSVRTTGLGHKTHSLLSFIFLFSFENKCLLFSSILHNHLLKTKTKTNTNQKNPSRPLQSCLPKQVTLLQKDSKSMSDTLHRYGGLSPSRLNAHPHPLAVHIFFCRWQRLYLAILAPKQYLRHNRGSVSIHFSFSSLLWNYALRKASWAA